MQYSIFITKDAYNDIDNLIDFYGKNGYDFFLMELNNLIYSAIFSLKIFPERCPVFSTIDDIRIMIVNKKFKIFYKVDKNKSLIRILKVSSSSKSDLGFFNF